MTGVIGANPGSDVAALTAIAFAHGLAIALLVAGTAKFPVATLIRRGRSAP